MDEAKDGEDFEPMILAFLCNWCSYAGADLAGVSRIQYPPNIRAIRVMCTGRIDPLFVMDAFKMGVDGVLIAGCHPGECHYLTGNYQARRRTEALRKLLARTGLEPERLHLEWISASEGRLFGEIVKDFTDEVRALGPSPLRDPSTRMGALPKIEAAMNVVADFKFRAFVSKEEELIETGNVYHEVRSKGSYDDLLDQAIEDEYLCGRILVMTEDRDASVTEMAEEVGIGPARALSYVSLLRKRNLLGLSRIEGTTPFYSNISIRGGE